MKYCTVTYPAQSGAGSLDVMVAGSTLERMRGLLRRPAPATRQGMFLPACRLIHTFGMGYPIDVIYLRRDGEVLKVTPALPPARMDGHWRAHCVLEMAAGEAAACGIVPGTRLDLRSLGKEAR